MSLRQKTILGLFWTALSQGGRQITQFFVTIILAKLLSPNDYGILGMATVFVGFLSMFSGLGFESAIIQKQEVTDNELNSAFWLNLISSLSVTATLIICAPYIAEFYSMPELGRVVVFLSLNVSIMALSMVHQAMLNREMRFKEIALRDITSTAISGVIGIYLAVNGYGAWSLVAQAIIFQLVSATMFWVLYDWHPRLQFSMSQLKEIFNFGIKVLGFKLANFWARNIDNLIIGRLMGSVNLGYYDLAYRIMLFPMQNMSSVIGQVLFPAFSEIKDNKKQLGRIYLEMVKGISLITYPLLFLVIGTVTEFIPVFLGLKWLPAVKIVQILGFCGIVQSTLSPCGNIILAVGRVDLQLNYGLIGAVWAIISILSGIHWGITGVASSYTLGQIIWALFIHGTIMTKLTETSFADFIAAIYKSLIIGIAGLVISIKIGQFSLSPIHMLFAKGGGIFFAYVGIFILFAEHKFVKRQFKPELVSR